MKAKINEIRRMLVNGDLLKRNGRPYSKSTQRTYGTVLNIVLGYMDDELDISSVRAKIRANGGESVTESQYVNVLAWAVNRSNEIFGTDVSTKGPLWGRSIEEFDMFIPSHDRVVKMIGEFVPKTKTQEKAFRYIKVAAITGARYSDMKSWTVEKNTAGNNLVYVPRKKGSRQVSIPIGHILKESFGSPNLLPKIPYSTLLKEVKNIFRMSGFTNEIIRTRRVGNEEVSKRMFEYEAMGLHRLRASAITGFLQSGMSETEAKTFSGHSFDSKSFKRYVEFSNEHLHDKFKGFSSRFQ